MESLLRLRAMGIPRQRMVDFPQQQQLSPPPISPFITTTCHHLLHLSLYSITLPYPRLNFYYLKHTPLESIYHPCILAHLISVAFCFFSKSLFYRLVFFLLSSGTAPIDTPSEHVFCTSFKKFNPFYLPTIPIPYTYTYYELIFSHTNN